MLHSVHGDRYAHQKENVRPVVRRHWYRRLCGVGGDARLRLHRVKEKPIVGSAGLLGLAILSIGVPEGVPAVQAGSDDQNQDAHQDQERFDHGLLLEVRGSGHHRCTFLLATCQG